MDCLILAEFYFHCVIQTLVGDIFLLVPYFALQFDLLENTLYEDIIIAYQQSKWK